MNCNDFAFLFLSSYFNNNSGLPQLIVECQKVKNDCIFFIFYSHALCDILSFKLHAVILCIWLLVIDQGLPYRTGTLHLHAPFVKGGLIYFSLQWRSDSGVRRFFIPPLPAVLLLRQKIKGQVLDFYICVELTYLEITCHLLWWFWLHFRFLPTALSSRNQVNLVRSWHCIMTFHWEWKGKASKILSFSHLLKENSANWHYRKVWEVLV